MLVMDGVLIKEINTTEQITIRTTLTFMMERSVRKKPSTAIWFGLSIAFLSSHALNNGSNTCLQQR